MALAKVRRPTGRDLYPSLVRSRQAKVILQAACSMQHAMLFPKELCSTRDLCDALQQACTQTDLALQSSEGVSFEGLVCQYVES